MFDNTYEMLKLGINIDHIRTCLACPPTEFTVVWEMEFRIHKYSSSFGRVVQLIFSFCLLFH